MASPGIAVMLGGPHDDDEDIHKEDEELDGLSPE